VLQVTTDYSNVGLLDERVHVDISSLSEDLRRHILERYQA